MTAHLASAELYDPRCDPPGTALYISDTALYISLAILHTNYTGPDTHTATVTQIPATSLHKGESSEHAISSRVYLTSDSPHKLCRVRWLILWTAF